MRRRSSSDQHSEGEKEKEKRRIAWMIQQEKEREHERLKRKKIEEYEKKRAEQLGLRSKRRSPCRSRSLSRSRSRSEESHHRSRVKHKTSRSSQVMSQKLNSSGGNKPFFNGPQEAPKLDEKELRQIIVNIHRKIPAPATETSEIRRDIVNHEEITLKRRDGEGVKPIFDRAELKLSEIEVEERRTIEAVGKNNLVKRSHVKRRSASLSPRRHRSPSPHAHSSSRSYTHRSRHDEYSRYQPENHHHHKDYKSERHYSDTRDNNREESRRRKSPRGRSHSRERDYHRLERDYSRSSRSEKEYREYRGRSKDRSYDRRDRRESSRERRLPPTQYVEQVPFPVYYSGFPPRPMLVGPAMTPIRGPMGRGRLPMAPIRPPFPPRFVGPQDIFRTVLPPDPRFGRMY